MRTLAGSCSAFFLFLGVFSSLGQSAQIAKTSPSATANSGKTDDVPAQSFPGLDAQAAPHAATKTATIDGSHPASLFNSLENRISPVTTTVEVRAKNPESETGLTAPMMAGGEDVINSAGTYGDVSRYLQLLPGVVSSSDLSNQMLVRGGHPMENLFLVDGIEVPNINHLANANSTGGFGPMIDAAAIQGLTLYTGGYGAKYPERLSSITELQTLESSDSGPHMEFDFGIQGIGGLAQRSVDGGDLLVSVHHGLMNLLSKDVGIDGVPSYTNELTRYRRSSASGARLTMLNTAGWDSIEIVPCASDTVETSTIESEYTGWRETTGAEWQRLYSPRAFAVMSVSDSEQVEHINQEDQVADPLHIQAIRHSCPIPDSDIQTTPVYQEDSNNAFSSASYRYEWGTSRIGLTAGTSVWLQRPDFQIAQPIGAFSPYSDHPVRTDSDSFRKSFSTGETGTYTQLVVHPIPHFSVSGGGRFQTFAFGSHTTVTPRLGAIYRIGENTALHASYSNYAQLPPYVYLLAYPVNQSMSPMQVTHKIVGMDLGIAATSQIRMRAYQKNYRSIPASTEYPAVTMHTMVDMVGEQFVWLPMTSTGRGTASGIELSDTSHFGSRVQMQGSIAYSRAKFAGTDRVLRPSNFDFPWIVNAAGVVHLGRGTIASSRFGYASGRPYTPYNLAQSTSQNRAIYDLGQVNAHRAPYYSRLDFQLSKEVLVHGRRLELYGGVDNVLNRSNFLTHAWMPRSRASNPERDIATLWQMPIFPNFGVRVIAR